MLSPCQLGSRFRLCVHGVYDLYRWSLCFMCQMMCTLIPKVLGFFLILIFFDIDGFILFIIIFFFQNLSWSNCLVILANFHPSKKIIFYLFFLDKCVYACVEINVLVSPFQFFWNIVEGGKVWHTVSQNLSVSNRLLELDRTWLWTWEHYALVIYVCVFLSDFDNGYEFYHLFSHVFFFIWQKFAYV